MRLMESMSKASRLVVALGLGACLAGLAEEADAGPLDTRATSCSRNNGGSTSRQKYSAYPASGYTKTVTYGQTSVPIPATPTRGTVLFSTQSTYLNELTGEAQGLAAPMYGCPPGTTEYFSGNGTLVDAAYNLYSTGLRGVGYRVYYYTRSGDDVPAPVTYTNSYAQGALVFPFSGEQGTLYTRIDFVATGEEIQAGTINAASIFGQSSTNAGISTGPLYKVSLSRNITLTQPTCAVSNPSALTIGLPDVSATQLRNAPADGFGYTETALDVNCTSAKQVPPAVKFMAANVVNGQPGTLSNQDAAGAKGVGVRLWLQDPKTGTRRVPTWNTVESGVATPNGTLPTSSWKFRMGATYVGVSTPVTAGTVKASATLTFTYS